MSARARSMVRGGTAALSRAGRSRGGGKTARPRLLAAASREMLSAGCSAAARARTAGIHAGLADLAADESCRCLPKYGKLQAWLVPPWLQGSSGEEGRALPHLAQSPVLARCLGVGPVGRHAVLVLCVLCSQPAAVSGFSPIASASPLCHEAVLQNVILLF